tara:strand:+ start:874 stop:1503 length:630 start_codon:yes stop_codon:yes gene_type:complete
MDWNKKMTYTSPYASNLQKMTNKEKVSLAQNRFTDGETQIAIAKNHYRLAREYLAKNTSVTPEAANELWKHKGYVLKCALIANGKKVLSEEEVTAFYRKNFKNRKNRHWRMTSTFLGGYRRYSEDNRCTLTTGALLEEIYTDSSRKPEYYTVRRFIEHPNLTLNLALRISTMKVPEGSQNYYASHWGEVKKAALMKVAEITKRESAASR